jgi:hypothetical protein
LEFEVNATKYVVKRIFGANILQTYMDMLLFTTTQCILGAVLSRIILINTISWKTCIGIAALVWLCEIIIIIERIVHMEHVSFPKILKGGTHDRNYGFM